MRREWSQGTGRCGGTEKSAGLGGGKFIAGWWMRVRMRMWIGKLDGMLDLGIK